MAVCNEINNIIVKRLLVFFKYLHMYIIIAANLLVKPQIKNMVVSKTTDEEIHSQL